MEENRITFFSFLRSLNIFPEKMFVFFCSTESNFQFIRVNSNQGVSDLRFDDS